MATYLIEITITPEGRANLPEPDKAMQWLSEAWSQASAGGQCQIMAASRSYDYLMVVPDTDEDTVGSFTLYLNHTGWFRAQSHRGYSDQEAKESLAGPLGRRI